jgi:peptidoglycan/xylan/chitin deacetylase (PgdA/CDA1 family)
MAPVIIEDPVAGTVPRHPTVIYYHHVHPSLEHYTSLTPSDFARSLDLLLECLSLCDPNCLWDGGRLCLPAEPSFLVTFDDGYRDVWKYGLPILEARGVRAMFFVTTGLVGTGSCSGDRPKEDYLDWPQCRELVARGHMVGAHGVFHYPLTDVTTSRAAADVRESIAEVESRLERACSFFAYPFGCVPAGRPICPENVWGFGTVKAPLHPWVLHPQCIRRTYLPTGNEGAWPALIAHWRRQWSRR